jgi:hypothetical protein
MNTTFVACAIFDGNMLSSARLPKVVSASSAGNPHR